MAKELWAKSAFNAAANTNLRGDWLALHFGPTRSRTDFFNGIDPTLTRTQAATMSLLSMSGPRPRGAAVRQRGKERTPNVFS
jgi:hypothetical protein